MDPPIYFLPGMGADRRLFLRQQRDFPLLRVLGWIPPQGRESLASYCERLAELLPPGDFVLGGVSLGGLFAQELAVIRRPMALLLVSTLCSNREISPPLRVGKLIPKVVHRALIGVGAAVGRMVTSNAPSILAARMLGDADPEFCHWSSKVVLNWEGSLAPNAPVTRIHGNRDRIIRPECGEGIHWVPGAGHLALLTHATEVNNLIRRALN